jgi:hypothetical protein
MHILLGDVVAKTGSHTGPMDVLEQAVVALVGCIEVIADAVDVLQERIEVPARTELALVPDAPSEPVDVRAELANLTRQVDQLTKTVAKLSGKGLRGKNKSLSAESLGTKSLSSKSSGKKKK